MYNFNPFPILKTERLILRKLEKTDSKGLFLMRNHPKVSQYIDRPLYKDLFEAADSIEKLNHGMEHSQWLFWAVSNEAEEFIGTICLWHFVEEENVADIGFELAPEYHRQGYMKEALEAVALYGFKVLGLKGIWGYTRPENRAAVELMKAFGFELADHIHEKDTQGLQVHLDGYLLTQEALMKK